MVLELISHVDAQIDAGPLGAFIDSYQSVETLKLGELWAIPIMLRLGLIENLQRISHLDWTAREECELAGLWVTLQEMAETNPSHLVIVVADMAKAGLSSRARSWRSSACACRKAARFCNSPARGWNTS
jgi:cyclic beta-1,2-glucan synthetase